MSPHEALLTTTSPAWSEPSEDGSTGVDFLGTRAVNLTMLTRLTGAYNNVVLSARQHTIVCWAAWRYRENCRAAGTDLKSGQFREFFDAIETIQLVGQRAVGAALGGTAEGLGSRALRQLGDGPMIPLRFKKYGRSHDNTSALAAVQYGPSSKPGSFDSARRALQDLVAHKARREARPRTRPAAASLRDLRCPDQVPGPRGDWARRCHRPGVSRPSHRDRPSRAARACPVRHRAVRPRRQSYRLGPRASADLGAPPGGRRSARRRL